MASTHRKRGSEVLLAYASPSICPPSSESDTSPISPFRDGRRRKNRDSSEDPDSVELPDGLINEDLRAGGPYLCAIPTRSVSLRGTPTFSQIEHRMEHLVQNISQILHWHEITIEEFDICGRISRIDPEPAVIPTAFIVTPTRSIDSKWVDACRQLLDFFRKEALPQFSVEIACRRAFESPCYFPVKRTDAIYPVWHQVLDCIFKDVELTGINAIECFRVGYNVNQDESQPTIVVSVNRRLSRNWKYIRERIVNIINSMSLWSVGVSIGPGEVLRQIAFPLDEFKAEAQAGLNLGVHRSEKSAGTLSGWIEIEHPRTKRWQKLALTCFHCVDPGMDSVHSSQQNRLKFWQTNGIQPEDPHAKTVLRVDQPSEKDIKAGLEELDHRIQVIAKDPKYLRFKNALDTTGFLIPPDRSSYNAMKAQKEKYEREKQHILNFKSHNEHELGYVFSASGYREERVATVKHPSENSILDWALIKPMPSRAGSTNDILGYGTPTIGLPERLILTGTMGPDMSQITTVFKAGRSTGYTQGTYNGLESAVIADKIVNGQTVRTRTLEHAVCGRHGQWFGDRGDSGSFVFTYSGTVIGMIFGGNTDRAISYFTHIFDIFNDIKKITGASNVRIFGDI
ncbi:hypothetical protein DTO212C5_6843 [Paecilomyces variotii]|nr:hypothetical protein DTO212C5_6843 [Paecilomyces variotii]